MDFSEALSDFLSVSVTYHVYDLSLLKNIFKSGHS